MTFTRRSHESIFDLKVDRDVSGAREAGRGFVANDTLGYDYPGYASLTVEGHNADGVRVTEFLTFRTMNELREFYRSVGELLDVAGSILPEKLHDDCNADYPCECDCRRCIEVRGRTLGEAKFTSMNDYRNLDHDARIERKGECDCACHSDWFHYGLCSDCNFYTGSSLSVNREVSHNFGRSSADSRD